MPHFTAPDGARLFYRDEGVGRPLLCLPGLTRTGADFDYLAPHLPPLRLIRTDYRGRGGSDWTGPETYTVPQEAADVVALLDHLGLDRVAVLGTSRGGIIGMVLAATARDRLAGLCLNDVGPDLAPAGLEAIRGYVGVQPTVRTHAEAAAAMEGRLTGFRDVPPERWLAEARTHFRQTARGLELTYDPALREAFEAAMATPVDMWPLFDACAGLPLALIRGANSDLLTPETVAEMQRRRPDMILAEVPDRAHIPFLDEPESLRVVHRFLGTCL
ncbi:MAG: alpha/beta fold hydrolase [Alkalilacustris sp.]